MLNQIINFFKHPIISIYNAGVQFLERLADKRIKKKLNDLPDIEERIDQYHGEGYTNMDILKHVKKREKANKMNKKAGGVLNELSLLPSLEFVSEVEQKKQIEARSSSSKIFETFRKNLDKSLNTILRRIESIGVSSEIIKKFKDAYAAASSSKISDFYRRNRSDFESMFVKYMGDIDDVEEVLTIWTKELS